MHSSLFLTAALAAAAHAHVAAWAPGMYCKGGNVTGVDDANTDSAVNPLYQKTQSDWWFQHYQGCDAVPPPEGEFLELPAGGSFTVELAHNRGQTSLSFGGEFTSEWPDGQSHPEDWSGDPTDGEGCIQDDGAMHVQNQSMATGTAFAISYQSEIESVTMEDLVVFTVLEHTPWKRLSTYSVPAALPACPPGGCTCAWLWVPRGCGIPNMYMQGFKCNVTGATSTNPVATAEAPVYCGGDAGSCVEGAKQMIAWNQATGDNVSPPAGVSPGYNAGMGWVAGAQNDIFVVAGTASSSSMSVSVATSTSSDTTTSSASTSPTSVKAISTTSSLSLTSATAVSKPISISSTPSSSTGVITQTTSPSSSSKPIISISMTSSSLVASTTPSSSSSSIAVPTTLITSRLTSASITPSTTNSSASTSTTPSSTSAAPVSTSTMFPDFVNWMEAAWAEWVASHGAQT